MLFQPELEAQDRDSRRTLQGERLAELLTRLRAVNTPYWTEKLSGVPDVESIDQIEELPFTVKDELRTTYPFDMLAVGLEDTVRVHASSGTRGKPTVVAYTARDVEIFAEVNARSIACAGGGPGDVFHVAYGYGLFTGGLGLHYGAETLGATAVPASGGNPGFQLQLLLDLSADGLACTPSFAMLLAERARREGILDRLNVRYGVFGAEPWSDAYRVKLEEAWGGIDACDIYGLSEVIGPGVAMECRESKGGLHVFEDHFYPEIVDPESGDPLRPGTQGELVLTTLTKEAQPVLRYRTGDITRLIEEPCPCGRTFRRIDRLTGRVDDMLIIRGINVFPREIEAVLLDDPDVGGQYAIIIDRRGTLTELLVRAEVASPALGGLTGEIAERVQQRLREIVRLRIEVEMVPTGGLPRQEVGKAQRVFVQTDDRDPVAG
jgi:phenylacetate-CoA ligase